MGVDYSTTLGYGITIDEIPSFISTEEWPDDFEIEEWLDRNGFYHIEYEKCGNWMSGEHIHLFYLTGTHQRLDWRCDEGVKSFDSPEITPESGIEFKRLCEELGLAWPDSLAWKLIFNVS